MIVLGLVLVVVALVIAIVLVTNGGQSVAMNFAGVSLDTTASWFFVAGVVAAVVAVLGLWCVRFGARRSLRMRKRNRELRKEAAANRDTTATDQNPVDGGDADTYFDSTPRE